MERPRLIGAFVLAGLVAAAPIAAQQIADPNVNMVRGLSPTTGDPFLQRQNEPSIAISTRNPCHLLATANDYKTVDIPDPLPLPGVEPSFAGDAWTGIYTSNDCGARWNNFLLPGYPQDISPAGLSSPLKGFDAGADGVARAATNGLFYVGGMVFNRIKNTYSRIYAARLIDDNNQERGEPIRYLDTQVLDTGTSGQFLDKPWLAVDIPRAGFGPGAESWTATERGEHLNPNPAQASVDAGAMCEITTPLAGGKTFTQKFRAGHAYMAWARFTGNGMPNPAKLMFARTTDCGKTWTVKPISDNQLTSQGATIAIAPHSGTVYVAWRQFGKNGKPQAIFISRSTDGGKTFSKPLAAIPAFEPYDQAKSSGKFRTNSLPTIAADEHDRVYVAVAARGYAYMPGTGGTSVLTEDARIVLAVSTDGGRTFAAPYAADPTDRRGHQVMPALTYAAGRLQLVYYDLREDASELFKSFVDDNDIIVPPDPPEPVFRHTIDVRSALAGPGAHPIFDSQQISQYRTAVFTDENTGEVLRRFSQLSAPNLPLFACGADLANCRPFIGDYIDVTGLSAVPSNTGGETVWMPNLGTFSFGASATTTSSAAGPFPPLPIFHATWTDNRDVRPPPDGRSWHLYQAPGTGAFPPGPDGLPVCSTAGMRNQNVYTSRLTPGLYVGSPGNTKPFGNRLNPDTNLQELIQRGFVLFLQNTRRDVPSFYRLMIAAPLNVHASWRQFDKDAPTTTIDVRVPAMTTLARTVYASSEQVDAQFRVDIQELNAPQGDPPIFTPKEGGLRTSLFFNADRSNPPIEQPDFVSDDVPQIAQQEAHDPIIFDPLVTAVFKPGTTTIDVKNPGEENPGEENPGEENPGEENPGEENPGEENPGEENPGEENAGLLNPGEENPGEENPGEENPGEENLSIENTALSDEEVANSTVQDIQWRVKNEGNTASSYVFSPVVSSRAPDLRFQLIITKRYYVPALNPLTCETGVTSLKQVVSNIVNFVPRTPGEENPGEENPGEENPGEENSPLLAAEADGPPPENVGTFYLAPGESVTITLRIYDLDPEPVPPDADPRMPPRDILPIPEPEEEVAAEVVAQAANTGETEPASASAGPDLITSEPAPSATPASVTPGETITLNWTLKNRGTSAAVSRSETIRARFYLSNDAALSPGDILLSSPDESTVFQTDGPLPACTDEQPTACMRSFARELIIPSGVPCGIEGFCPLAPGSYFVIVIADDDDDAGEDDPLADPENEVFEADDFNNFAAAPLTVGEFHLQFTAPVNDAAAGETLSSTSPIRVAIRDSRGTLVDAGRVPHVSIEIGSSPSDVEVGLGGTTLQPNVGGFVSFDDLSIGRPGIGYTLRATAARSAAAVSNAFAIDGVPVALPDAYAMDEDGSLTIGTPGVLANDTDVEGGSLTAAVVREPAFGALNLSPSGAFTYVPQANFFGTDTFMYRASDGRSLSNEALVTITVRPVPDAPVANADSASTPKNQAIDIDVLANDTDADGDTLTIQSVTQPANGSAAIQGGVVLYTPNGTFVGDDSFSYTIDDGTERTATATVTVTVTEAACVPVPADLVSWWPGEGDASDIQDGNPGAMANGATFGPAMVGQGFVLDGLIDYVEVASAPNLDGMARLTVDAWVKFDTVAEGKWQWVVAKGLAAGDDTGSYYIWLAGDTGRITAAVDTTMGLNTVDTPDVIVPGRFYHVAITYDGSELVLYLDGVRKHSGSLSGPVRTNAFPLLIGRRSGVGVDGNGDALDGVIDEVEIFSRALTADEILAIYAAGPAGKCPPNRPPQAGQDEATVAEDGTTTIDVLANDSDPDGDAVTLSSINQPAHGTAEEDDGRIRYTPHENFHGRDEFSYVVTDGKHVAVGTVRVTVTPVNDAPTANDDAGVVIAGRSVSLNVVANDTDPDNGTGGSVVDAIPFLPPGAPGTVGAPGEIAAVPGGQVYAAGRDIGVLNPASNTLVARIALPNQISSVLHRFDAGTGLIHFQQGSNVLTTVDTATNQIRASITLGGSINSFDLDSVRHLLYVTTPGPFQSRVAIIDANPTSGTFYQVLASVDVPGFARGIAVNERSNRIYVAGSSPATLYAIDGATRAIASLAPGTTIPVSVAVNEADGLVFATTTSGLTIYDEAANTATQISLPGFTPFFSPNRRLAVNETTGRVYARSASAADSPSRLFIIDGRRGEGLGTVLATVAVGAVGLNQDTNGDFVIDEPSDRLVVTIPSQLRTVVLNGADGSPIASIPSPQATADVELDSTTGTAWVAGTLTIIQRIAVRGTPALVGTIATGAEAGAVAVNRATHKAYVGRADTEARVQILDRDGDAGLLPNLPHGAGRYTFVATNSLTNRLFVLNASANLTGDGPPSPGFLSFFDGATHARLADASTCVNPFGLAVDEANDRVWVACTGAGSAVPGGLAVLNASTAGHIVSIPSLPGTIGYARDIAFTATHAYARSAGTTGPAAPTAAFVDLGTFAATALPTTLGQINIIRTNGALNRVYLGNGAGQLHVLNGSTQSLIATHAILSFSPFIVTQSTIAVDESRGLVYAADFVNDLVRVLDGDTGAILATIATGDGPGAVAVNTIENRIYVANANERSMTFIDGATRTVRGTLPLPFQANLLAVDEAENRIYTSNGSLTESAAMVIEDAGGALDGLLTVSSFTQGAQGSVALNPDGTVVYTPSAEASGTDAFTYVASDGVATSNNATVTVAIRPALQILTEALPNGEAGVAYNHLLEATGGSGKYTWTVIFGPATFPVQGTLPLGLALDTSGALSGIPASGTYTFTLRVRDSDTPPQTVTRTFTIIIAPPIVATTFLPNAFKGTPYNQTLMAAGVIGTPTWDLAPGSGPLPDGLELSPEGVISGTPTRGGFFSFTVRVTDSSERSGTRALSIFVDGPLEITTTTTNEGVLFETYSTPLQWTGGRAPVTFSLAPGSNPLPDNLVVRSFGSIQSPFEPFPAPPAPPLMQSGTFDFTVQATDSSVPAPQTDTQDLSLRISALDQWPFGGGETGQIEFGPTSGREMAQIFTSGVDGPVSAIRLSNISCPPGVNVVVEVQGVTRTFPPMPNGIVLTEGTGVAGFTPVPLHDPHYLPVESPFAVVLRASGGDCQAMNLGEQDFYRLGHAATRVVTATDVGPWQTLQSTHGKPDLNIATLVLPLDLAYMHAWRSGHTATKLADGRVLVVGAGGGSSKAEVYDPATGRFTETANTMSEERNWHTATLLSSGHVLIVGGQRWDPDLGQTVYLDSAEIYDPATNRFTLLAVRLGTARQQHTATLLPDGRVLIVGGTTVNPATGFFEGVRTVEIYSGGPAGSFSSLGDRPVGRWEHSATLLNSGKVLVAGGYTSGPGPFASAETFDPDTDAFNETAGALPTFRAEHTATLLADGRVVIAGGSGNYPDLATNYVIYDPATDSFDDGGPMAVPRLDHTTTLLNDGTLLVAGGTTQWPSRNDPFAGVERYTPGASPGIAVGAGMLKVTRGDHTATLLDDGRVLVAGGWSRANITSRSAEVYDPAAHAFAITTATLPDGEAGEAYSGAAIETMGGTAPISFSVASGDLPAGLVMNESGEIEGTPTAAGPISFVVRAVDSSSPSQVALQRLTITVNRIVITTATMLPTAVRGQAYSAQLEATGWGAKTWSLECCGNSLPPGLTLNTDGSITGTPTQNGFFWFTLKAVDSIGQEARKQFNIEVFEPLTITSTTTNEGVLFEHYWTPLQWTGGRGPVTFSLAPGSRPLPDNLVVRSWGAIEIPFEPFPAPPPPPLMQTGTFSFTVQATDSSVPTPQTATQDLSLRISALDQWPGGDGTVGEIQFGLTSGLELAQVLTSGVDALATGVRLNQVNCPPGANVVVQLQGVTGTSPPLPNGIVLAEGTGVPGWTPIPFTSPHYLPVESPFSVVLRATGGDCRVDNPPTQDFYRGGQGFSRVVTATEAGPWQSLQSTHGRSDVPLASLVLPSDLIYEHAWRSAHVATTLLDGRVLVTGGGTTQAEIYDPATNRATAIPDQMDAPRFDHTATLLPGGEILIIGGSYWDQASGQSFTLDTAEIFDPATNTFTTLAARLGRARQQHTATLLADGRVLIVGGSRFNPATGFWESVRTDEIHDGGASGVFTPLSERPNSRWLHTATLLNSGDVLLVGGYSDGFAPPLPSAERFSPLDNSFTATTGDLPTFRSEHTATRLADGRVVIAGGAGIWPDLATNYVIYDPATDSFDDGGPMGVPRLDHTATLLDDGRLLVAGGTTQWSPRNDPFAGIELYTPGASPGTVEGAGMLKVTRARHSATLLDDGRVFVAGGWSRANITGRSAELYDPTANAFAITTITLPDGEVGVFYPGVMLQTTGGTPPIRFGILSGSLPDGIVLDSGDFIIGTPSVAGPASFVMRAVDSSSPPKVALQRLTIVVNRLVITTATMLPTGVRSEAYFAQLEATGWGAKTWSVLCCGNPPPGLTLNSDGSITGTPTQAGFFWLTVVARDSIGQEARKQFNIEVFEPLTITTTSLDDGVVPWSYWSQISITGGRWPFRFEVIGGSMPPGVSLDPNGGFFSGNIEATGAFAFDVKITDSSAPPQEITAGFTIRVGAQDQWVGPVETPANVIPITSNEPVAQTMRTATTGLPLHLQMPVSCSSGDLLVSIVGLKEDGTPDQEKEIVPLTIIPGPTLPPFGDGFPAFRQLRLPFPFLRMDSRLAVVLASNGSCAIAQPSSLQPDPYPDGEGFRLTDGVWQPLAATDSSRPDLPFNLIIDDQGRLAYMMKGRSDHTETLLPSGKVLLYGGSDLPGGQLYDPAGKKYGDVSAPPGTPRRWNPTATLLANGKVLIAGGQDFSTNPATGHDSAELYDPTDGSITPTAAMSVARFFHTATLLNDGRVLVTGGLSAWNQSQLATAELYDPDTGTWSPAAPMSGGRQQHTATLLNDGRVLVAAGWGNHSRRAEIYVPDGGQGTFMAPATDMRLFRSIHTATLMSCGTSGPACAWDGSVLIAGGSAGGNPPGPVLEAEAFNPIDNTFRLVGSLGQGRQFHAAAALPNGNVLVAGGEEVGGSFRPTASLEVYSPSMETFTAAGDMTTNRSRLTATRLLDGTVLLASGYGSRSPAWISSELFDSQVLEVVVTRDTLLRDGDTTLDNTNLVVDGSTLTIDGFHRFDGLTLRNGATLTHSSASGTSTSAINIEVRGTLGIDATSRIDVTGKGFLGSFNSIPPDAESGFTWLTAVGRDSLELEATDGGYRSPGSRRSASAASGSAAGFLRARYFL